MVLLGAYGRSFDSVSLAAWAEDLNPGDFVNFASQKSDGDDRAFTVGNLGALFDRRDQHRTANLQFFDVHR